MLQKLCERFSGLRVTVIGAAREGTALARTLARCGAQVTLSDNKPAERLGEALVRLEGLAVRLVLGAEQPDDLLDVDVLFLSPGVPPYAPIVGRARERGLPISSEPRLCTQILSEMGVPVVGITGSSGKSTTTALTGRMLAAAGQDVWVGGNIGQPLIEYLLERQLPDVAVLELSSFQLELFSADYQGPTVGSARSPGSRVINLGGWSPNVAAVTNITPNHLDRHPSMADYVRCKQHLLVFQRAEDWGVFNHDDSAVRDLARGAGREVSFSLQEQVARGAYASGDDLMVRWDGERRLCSATDLRLRGRHNVANVLTATCCALAAGAPLSAIRQAAVSFEGVPHRLEPVRTWRGVQWVNDSIATSPERAIAAMAAYDEPLVLLAGGRDKHLPWDRWAELVQERARLVIAFGELCPVVASALAGQSGVRLREVETLDSAVALAAEEARPGEIVLLSPGGTSFDAYTDFEARGVAFRGLVETLGSES